MSDHFLIIIFGLLLTACDNKPANKEAASDHQDISLTDSSLIRANNIFDNPFRDINNFDPIVGYSVVDDLHERLSKDPQTTINIKRDMCAGDNCTSFKTLKNGNTILHLFKSDVGEYGFSNDQFILTGDTLSVARNFNVGIETWPTDSTETVWSCTEKVFYFYPDYVKILERKVLTKDLYAFDFTLKDAEYQIQSPRGTNLYKDKYDELIGLLTTKVEDE